jgi:hypothetical protein
MHFELKMLSTEAIPRAIEKAERYRLLNEPGEAESICLDVLQIDADHQAALITLLLARTDQFEHGGSVAEARDVLPKLRDEYDRAYYAGIICERRAKARWRQGGPGAAADTYEWLREAMSWFERAEALRPPGNDDATLRWNTCARVLMRNPRLQPAPTQPYEAALE